MKYIVTGATSCIGNAVCQYLLEKGDTVIAVMRKGSAKEESFRKQFADFQNLNIVHADFSESYNIKNHVSQADVYINFAWAGTSKEQRNSPEIQNENVKHSLNAMRVANELGCKVYVEAGSQAEYGWQGGELSTEESPCNPFSEYGKAKLKTWQEGKDLAKELGMSYVHLRIFSVYGETESDAAILPYCIRQSIKNEPIELSPCTQSWNFLYRHDAAEMICRLAEKHYKIPAKQEVYNIASNDTRVLSDFVKEMAESIKTSSELKFGAVMPSRLLSLSPSIEKTLSTIGEMKFTPFDEGLENEYKYIKDYD